MLAWMVYVIVVGVFLAGAALAAERSAQIRGAPTRWIWGASIIGCLVLPSVISSVSVRLPSFSGGAGLIPPPAPFALRQFTVGAMRPSAWLDTTIGPLGQTASADALLIGAWVAASAVILLAILSASALLRWRQRTWDRREIAGTEVFVSEDVGPAVVGLLRPRIVLPRWIAESPPETQALVLAHERSHIAASDAQLLTLAILLIVAMPWNLPLWWQLRRLRFAIEMDCDARVLASGHDVARYGETLIMVGERQSRRIAVVAAMSESNSFLEQRIRRMLSKPKKFAWAGAMSLAGLAFVLAASAAEVSPPNASPLRPDASQASASGTRHYESADASFALDVPSAWDQAPPDLANSSAEVVRFLSKLNHGDRDVLIVFRGDYDPAKGVKAASEAAVEGLAKAGYSHFVHGEAKLGSRTVQTLEFDITQGGKLWSCRQFVLPEGTHLYILGFGTTQRARMFPAFDRIAASFVLNGKAAVADKAAPAVTARPAVVEVRLVDNASDAGAKAGDQRVAAPDGGELWLAPGAPITGAMFASAEAGLGARGEPVVNFSLTPEGSSRFAVLTRENVGRRLAIVVDGKVVWAPLVRDEIAGGKGQISGRFTTAETEALARQIRAASAGG